MELRLGVDIRRELGGGIPCEYTGTISEFHAALRNTHFLLPFKVPSSKPLIKVNGQYQAHCWAAIC